MNVRQAHITAMIMHSVRIWKVHILVLVIPDLKGMVSLVQVSFVNWKTWSCMMCRSLIKNGINQIFFPFLLHLGDVQSGATLT